MLSTWIDDLPGERCVRIFQKLCSEFLASGEPLAHLLAIDGAPNVEQAWRCCSASSAT